MTINSIFRLGNGMHKCWIIYKMKFQVRIKLCVSFDLGGLDSLTQNCS